MKTQTCSIRFRSLLLAAVGLILVALQLVFSARLVGAIARGYISDDPGLVPGMVAALSQDSIAQDPRVERASSENRDRAIGVVVIPAQAQVTEVSRGDDTYIETSGELDVYVSDVNGTIARGDLLAVSPLSGVLMHTSSSQTNTIMAIALEDFSGIETQQRQLQDGRRVALGRMRVNLDHRAASNQQAGQTDSSLERLGEAVVGRDVGEIRVLAALVIFFIVLVAEGGIIYGAVSSALTALGRNPMAKKIIQREMIRVIIIAFLVLAIGIGAIYLVLWV